MALVSNRVGAFSAHFDRTRLFYTTKKSRKKYRNSALAAIISSMLMWIQTLKLRWHYGESNAQVYESYGFSYTGVIWTGILSLLYIEHDNVIGGVNRFLYYFQCFKRKTFAYIKLSKILGCVIGSIQLNEIEWMYIKPLSLLLSFVILSFYLILRISIKPMFGLKFHSNKCNSCKKNHTLNIK